MVGYGVHRFVNELLRSDPRPGNFERYVSLLLIGSGMLLGYWLWRKPAQYHCDSAEPESRLTSLPATVATRG